MTSFRVTSQVREKDTSICLDESSSKKINFLSILFQPYLKIEYNGNVEIIRYVKLLDCNKIEVERGEFNTTPLNFPPDSCIEFYTPNACDKGNKLKEKVFRFKKKLKNLIIKGINFLWSAVSKAYCFLLKIWHRVKDFLLYLLHLTLHYLKKIFWLIVDSIDYFINLLFKIFDKVINLLKYIWNELKSIVKWVFNELKQAVVFFTDKIMCAFNGLRMSIDSQLTNLTTIIVTLDGLNALGNALTGILNSLNDFLANSSNAIGGIISNIANSLGDSLQGIGKFLTDTFNKLLDMLKGILPQ